MAVFGFFRQNFGTLADQSQLGDDKGPD